MAELKIVYYPDEPLTRKAAPVEEFGPELLRFANDMLETMDANEGVGLAAPQVGVSRRMFVLCEPDGEPMCLVNPEIYEQEGREYGEEGCLSLPQVYAKVPRCTRIRVRAKDPLGNDLDFEACDFLARIIQHEYDHLEGVVFPDRLDVFSREDAMLHWEEQRRQLNENTVRRA